MFELENLSEEYRANPWIKPYVERIDKLKQAKLIGKKTVAYLSPVLDNSTFRYRGYNTSESLEYSMLWTGSYFDLGEIKVLFKEILYVDVLTIIRCPWDRDIENLINKMHSLGKKVIYDVDDLIYDPKYMNVIIDTLSLDRDSEWNFWFGLTLRNKKVIEMCDATITTNDYLAKYLENDLDVPCYILHNYLNRIQEKVSERYLIQKLEQKNQGYFEIGYFSGSPTHKKDLQQIMPEIIQLLNENYDIRFKIVGYMDFGDLYKEFVEKGQIYFVPFQTMVGLQYEQARVNVNVVPLISNDFTNCKSELKYFENAIVGTITCATPSYTYAKAIHNGDNGYLCEVGQWYSAIKEIYKDTSTKDKMKNISDIALNEYGEDKQVKLIEDILDKVYEG